MKCSACKEREADQRFSFLANQIGVRALCESCARRHFSCRPVDATWNQPAIGNTYGIEAELNPTLLSYLKIASTGAATITEDNSLRGMSCEIVSPVLGDNNFEEWVHLVFDDVKATLYNRCGLHVWLLTRPIGWFGLNSNMYYWSLEPNYKTLLSIIPRHRRPAGYNNAGTPMSMEKWNARLYGNKYEFMRSIYGDCGYLLRNAGGGSLMVGKKRANDKGDQTYPRGPICRYWWMNVHGHFRQGAVEIRIHPGTVDPYAIVNILRTWRIWLDTFSDPKNHKLKPFDPLPRYLVDYWTSVQTHVMTMKSPLDMAEDVI